MSFELDAQIPDTQSYALSSSRKKKTPRLMYFDLTNTSCEFGFMQLEQAAHILDPEFVRFDLVAQIPFTRVYGL